MTSLSDQCDLHRTHHPTVARLWMIGYDDSLITICGTGRDNLRIAVDYMQGGRSPDAKIGRETWDLAQKIVAAHRVIGL